MPVFQYKFVYMDVWMPAFVYNVSSGGRGMSGLIISRILTFMKFSDRFVFESNVEASQAPSSMAIVSFYKCNLISNPDIYQK